MEYIELNRHELEAGQLSELEEALAQRSQALRLVEEVRQCYLPLPSLTAQQSVEVSSLSPRISSLIPRMPNTDLPRMASSISYSYYCNFAA